MSFMRELTNGLIDKGFVSAGNRNELEKYLRARDEFNDLFGGNDGIREIKKDLHQNQDALRGRINGLMETAENCGLALGKSISSVHEIEKVAASCLDVLDKSLLSGLKQKTKDVYELADELGHFYSSVYSQAKEIDRHFHKGIETLTNLKKSLINFEGEMLGIKTLLTNTKVDKR